MIAKVVRRSMLIAMFMGGGPAMAAVGWGIPEIGGDWHLTWADEFNSGSTATDLAGWTYDLGDGSSQGIPGWGNNELESYTRSSSNVSVSTSGGVGALNIDAIKTGPNSYSSARIRTNNIFSQAYGVIEFRAKLPVGQGLWPAVWMMPENSVYGGWPSSGEIDILESKGSQPGLVQGTLHSGPNYNQDNVQTGTFAGSGKEPAGFSTADWHTYDLEWNAAGGFGRTGSLTFYVDGIPYQTYAGGWTVPSGAGRGAPFDQPFYLIINMAVGGNYGGSPNLNYGTSYNMAVDYVRAYSSELLGDTNNDGLINVTDFNTLVGNLGKHLSGGFSVGDFNGDGVVNADDVSLFQFGAAELNDSAGQLPEPAAAGILAILAVGFRRPRRI